MADCVSFIKQEIRHICTTYRCRSAGSESERRCQRYFKSLLSDWSDSIQEEEFTLHPNAFVGWLIPAGILCIASIITFWLRLASSSIVFPILSAATVTMALLMFVFEYLFYFRFIDFIFPKRQSMNVFASRKPSGELRRRIIFGGHADAAYEMAHSFHGGDKNILRIIAGAAVGMLFILGVNVAMLIITLNNGVVPITGIWRLLGFIEIAFVPLFLDITLFVNWRCVVDGANDNLSGCLVAIGVLREMAERGMRMKHTEVCCLITGGEESGLRGAYAFAKKHKNDMANIQTIFIALDTLRECGEMMIYTRGMNGTQRNDGKVAALLYKAGKRCGIPMRTAGFYPGATDAEAFSRHGILACGLCGVSHIPMDYYHTRYDTFDNIDESCLDLSLKICLEAAMLFDENGL